MTLVFSADSLMSQPPPLSPNTDAGPIDSGQLFLLAAVGCYGYLQLRKKDIAL